jgi:GT2 family glycosyltransferase
MQAPRVAVITVLYRSERFVPALLESVAAVDYPRDRLELHLVDNGPGDGSLASARRELERLAGRLPPVIVHEPGRNEGFAIGNNIALRAALERGADHCFLLNADATLEPAALREAVAVAEGEPRVGAVQSLLLLADEPDLVNTRGNEIHFLGFGYAGGYRQPRAEVPDAVAEVTYTSGAAMLLPRAALLEVGLFDETLWLYHEDLDLGWRLRLHGYRNLLAPRSVCRHHYEFSRSTGKWYWMERNRWLVILKNYQLPTLLLIAPLLLTGELGLLALALKGGWWPEKLRALSELARPRTWAYLLEGRRALARTRRVPDREILTHFTAVIAHPDFASPLVQRLVEPVWRASFALLKAIVVW